MGSKPRLWSEEIAEMVTRVTGVQFGDKRGAMLEGRLHRRMAQLDIRNPNDYLQYVRKNSRTELAELISLLTSHHTFFFREFRQFQFLADTVLPKILPKVLLRADRTLRVWSAACSQGQEVYSLAMFLKRYLHEKNVDVNFEVLGTDVDATSIAFAKNGVYEWKQIREIPLLYIEENWTRGTDDIRGFARAKDTLRHLCRFETENLLQMGKASVDSARFDVIFCRNVLIYFQPEQVRQVAENLITRLYPHGHLFIGVSESLLPFELPLRSVAPSIYAKGVSEFIAEAPLAMVSTTRKRPRVLCVDDSPTVLRLLKRILEPDFDLVGTAANGIEASQQIAALKPDLVTLDIHMPVQSGVEFLQSVRLSELPPVVMLSSVSPEDSGIALRCLELGARDYIEKPDLISLEWRADEIRAKLHSAMSSSAPKTSRFSKTLAPTYTRVRKPARPDDLWLFVASVADRDALESVIREIHESRAPIAIVIEGASGILPALAKSLSEKIGTLVEYRSGTILPIHPGSIALLDGETMRGSLTWAQSFRTTCILYFSVPNQKQISLLLRLPNPRLLIEERHFGRVGDAEKWHSNVRFVPATSFAHHLLDGEDRKVSNG